MRSLKLNKAKQWLLLKGPDSSAGLCNRLVLAPFLHSPYREHHNTAKTEIHPTWKVSNEVLGKCLSFSEVHPVFLNFPIFQLSGRKGLFIFPPRPEGHCKKLTCSSPQHSLHIFLTAVPRCPVPKPTKRI